MSWSETNKEEKNTAYVSSFPSFTEGWLSHTSCSIQVKREVGDVTILVNNAGIVTGKKFMDAPDSLIEKTMEVNTMAHFWVSPPHQHTD